MSQVKILNPTDYHQDVIVRVAGAAVSQGAAVKYDITTSGDKVAGQTVIEAAAGEHVSQVTGIALDAAASGEQLRVCTRGVCDALVDGDVANVTAGHALDVSAGTAGELQEGGAAAAGDRIIAIEANAGTTTLALVEIK